MGVDALMQIVAWSRMVVSYSSDAGLAEGVAKTFDGRHPCELCKAIARTRENEGKRQPQDVQRQEAAFRSFISPDTITAPEPPSTDFVAGKFPPMKDASSILGDRPPLPPPREARA